MRPQILASFRALPPGVRAPLPGPVPDRLLVEHVARGHHEAMQHLRDRHAMSLYALAYGIAMDPTDAEEIVDATFDALWRMASQYVCVRGSVYAWLADMTRSYARGMVRARDWPCRTSLFQT